MISDSPQPGFLSRLEGYCRILCEANWQDPNGPLRLNQTMASADLRNAEFYQKTKQFLLAVQEQQGAPVTATGNLSRVFVKLMFDRLPLSPLLRETMLRYNKVINEQDLWALHLSRVVSECGGLVKLRAKRFKLTREGKRLSAEDCAGELYHKLFISYFRKFDLRYGFRLRDVPGIQQSMAVILWRLDEVAHDWRAVKHLAPHILLPRVLKQLHEVMTSPYDKEEWILSGYVLEPLHDFGLIECKKPKGAWKISEDDSIRITPLWNQFISFSPFAG